MTKLDYATAEVNREAAGPPWVGILAIIMLVGVPVSGPIPLSRYELNPVFYIPPMVLTVIAGFVGWRGVRSKIRADKLIGLPVLVVSILLIVFIVADRLHYLW